MTPIYLHSQQAALALTDWLVVRSILLNLLAFILWPILGLGLATLIRSQFGAVLAAMGSYLLGAAAILIVSNLAYLTYHHSWVLGAPVVAPAVASLIMTTPRRAFDHAPPQWAGLLVMIGYVLILGAIGIQRTPRQDIS